MESKAKLKHERDKRPRPHLDDKIITSWNGLSSCHIHLFFLVALFY